MQRLRCAIERSVHYCAKVALVAVGLPLLVVGGVVAGAGAFLIWLSKQETSHEK